jgi:hypothetical protein
MSEEKARREIVKSIEGLYDEVSKAVLMQVNNRKRCFSHSFINASLHWESPHTAKDDSYYSIDLQSRKIHEFDCEWGFGYGAIRYCEKCKYISCIHLWDKAKFVVYQIDAGPFYHDEWYVETCRICGRRIRTGGCGVSKPSDEGWRILMDEHKALTGSEFKTGSFGSGYSCELPVHLSEVFASAGEAAARQAARAAFQSGDISYLMRRS